MEERADQLRQEINMYKMQTKAQKSETNAIREQITEAKTEIESIEYEKKQLYQQWNTSLIGLRRRDDALIIAKESLAENRKKVRNLDTEIEGYKRSVQDEEDKNEKNTGNCLFLYIITVHKTNLAGFVQISVKINHKSSSKSCGT